MRDCVFDFRGWFAVVTGASGVIGGGFAEALIEAGANVAMSYNGNPAPVEARIARHAGNGRMLRGYKVNAMHPEEIAANAEAVMRDFGRIDMLVNCAGGHLKGSISDGGTTFFDLDPLVCADAMSRRQCDNMVYAQRKNVLAA